MENLKTIETLNNLSNSKSLNENVNQLNREQSKIYDHENKKETNPDPGKETEQPGIPGPQIEENPNDPSRVDPTRQDERENDHTRIKPGVNEPGKVDPTRITEPV